MCYLSFLLFINSKITFCLLSNFAVDIQNQLVVIHAGNNEINLDGFHDISIGKRSSNILKLKNNKKKKKTGIIIARTIEGVVTVMKNGKKDDVGMLALGIKYLTPSFRNSLIEATKSYYEDNILMLMKNAITAAAQMNNKPHLISLLSIIVANAILKNESYSKDIQKQYGVSKYQVACAKFVVTERYPGIGDLQIHPRDRRIQIKMNRIRSLVIILQSETKLAATNFLLRAKGIKYVMNKSIANMIGRYKALMKRNFSTQKPISDSYLKGLLSQKCFIAPKSEDTVCDQCHDGIICFSVHYTILEQRILQMIGQIEEDHEQNMFRDFTDKMTR